MRRIVEVVVEFEVENPDEDILDEVCLEAELMVRDVVPEADHIMADVVRDEEVG